jgi:hypothetical protein
MRTEPLLLVTLLVVGGCRTEKLATNPVVDERVNKAHEADGHGAAKPAETRTGAAATLEQPVSDETTKSGTSTEDAACAIVDQKAAEFYRKMGVLEHLENGAPGTMTAPGTGMTEDQLKVIDEALGTVHHEAKDMPPVNPGEAGDAGPPLQ